MNAEEIRVAYELPVSVAEAAISTWSKQRARIMEDRRNARFRRILRLANIARHRGRHQRADKLLALLGRIN